MIEAEPRPSVFIGKPCDVAAAVAARRLRPRLDATLGLTIAILCAGTPSTQGTLKMLDVMGVDPAAVSTVHYRGQGWPGQARTEPAGRRLSYEESWGAILASHRPWRCYLCADHTGEYADISVGDAWHRPTAGDSGQSLIIARTERGRRVVTAAIAAGVLIAQPVDFSVLPAAQPGLLRVRGAVWGRIAVLRLLGLPAPKYRGFPMFRIWLRHLSIKDKLRSTLGTIRRIHRRKLYAEYSPTHHNPAPAPDTPTTAAAEDTPGRVA